VLEFQTDQSKIRKFEDTKEAIRSRKWKDRQHNDQKKKTHYKIDSLT